MPLLLADGKQMNDIRDVVKFAGGPKKVEMNSMLLTPIPIVKSNLNLVIDAKWITRAEVVPGRQAGHGQGLRLIAPSTMIRSSRLRRF